MVKQSAKELGYRIVVQCKTCKHGIEAHDEGGKGKCTNRSCKCELFVKDEKKFNNKVCSKCGNENAYDVRHRNYPCKCGNVDNA